MDQAAWNLCPVSDVVSGTSCYYADDQTFTELSGTTTVVIDDCPDGELTNAPLFGSEVLLHHVVDSSWAGPAQTMADTPWYRTTVWVYIAHTACTGDHVVHLLTV